MMYSRRPTLRKAVLYNRRQHHRDIRDGAASTPFDTHYDRRITVHEVSTGQRPNAGIARVVECLNRLIQVSVTPGTRNLVDSRRSILDITDVLRGSYPNLEMICIG